MPHTEISDRLQNVEQDLLEFIRRKLIGEDGDAVVLDAGTLLFEDGLINSINILALIGFVERRVGRRLDDSEILMQNFRSVRTIVGAFL